MQTQLEKEKQREQQGQVLEEKMKKMAQLVQDKNSMIQARKEAQAELERQRHLIRQQTEKQMLRMEQESQKDYLKYIGAY